MLKLIAADIQISQRQAWLADMLKKQSFDALIVESHQGERELARLGFTGDILQYNEHSKASDEKEILSMLQEGKELGLLSDGGAPIAGDPGWQLVRLCHQKKIKVSCLGVHSFILASLLMSGCDGNRFCFHGYPPRDKEERGPWLRKQLSDSSQTHLFMEPPYRFNRLIEELLPFITKRSSQGLAWLSVSLNIGEKDEMNLAGDAGFWEENLQRLPAKALGIAVLGK